MRTVTIEIADGYDEILALTLIGRGRTTNVAQCVLDLRKTDHVEITENGEIEYK